MRLFLASYRFGEHYDRLAELVGGPCQVAVIGNACDAWPPAARAAAMTSDLLPLRRLGYDAVELDLRDFITPSADLEAALAAFPFVWVRGGNTFVLRAQLARSGADVVLIQLLRKDALVYGGYSAGACVLAPSLHGLELMDDPAEVEPTCGIAPRWDGLGLIDHQLVVHADSPTDPQGDSARLALRYYAEGTPYRVLTDEDVLVVDGSTEDRTYTPDIDRS